MAIDHRMTSVRRSVRSAAALAPTWTLITLGVLVPLAALMWGARTGIAGSVDSSVSIGARLARTGRVTLIQAGASTVATLVVGLPVAWVLARFRFFGRGLIRALVAAPFVLPSVVVGAAVLALAGPSGPFGSFAPQPGSAGSLALVVFAHVGYELVVVVVIVGARLESMPSTHVEAARTMGAGSWRRGASVVVPQVLPAVAGAGALVFLLTSGSLGVVLVLGGPRWGTLDSEVWYLGTQLLDLKGAAVLALVQAAAVVVVGLVAAVVRRGGQSGRPGVHAVEWSGGGTTGARAPRGGEWALVIAALGLVAVFSVAPFVALATRLGSVSAQGFGRLWTDGGRGIPPLGPAAGRSLAYAVVVALVCTAAALGVGLAAREGRGSRTQGVIALPVGVSAAAVGLGVVLMSLIGPVDLRGSVAAVVLVQAAMALPFAVGVIVPVLTAVPKRLEEAAATLGAGVSQQRRRVVVPLAAAGIAGGAALAAAAALGEFGASTFVVRGDAPTLPTLVGRLLSRQAPEAVATGTLVAAVLGLLCGLLVVLAQSLARRAHEGPEP